MRQLTIIGSGPAGWTAAIYAARARLEPLVIASSVEPGGDLMKTTDVENYPGFPESITGPELMRSMQVQAERFGAHVRYDDVVGLDLDPGVKRIRLGSGEEIETLAVIYATGSAYRRLGIPGEDRLAGAGVSWCATCDGAFFRDRPVAVIGGGDSALEEATFLTRFASTVHLIHRRGELRGSRVMQDRAAADPRIRIMLDREVRDVIGGDRVEAIEVIDRLDGTASRIDVDGVFVAIGSDPRTDLIAGQLPLTEHGTIEVEGRSTRTAIAGVFAAGDVVDHTYRQAITAAASGATAAMDAEHYLASLPATALAQRELTPQ